jgi:hypothetical protein
MTRLAKLPFLLALLACARFAVAQGTLGELLDAGARKLSVEEFQKELVQRLIVGPSPTRGTLELIYGSNGVVQGIGTPAPNAPTVARETQILGQWTIGENGTVCTSMRISSQPGGSLGMTGGYFPPRCQFWFKLGDMYFLSDSDTDRSMKVLSRTLKQ